jgi:hypothetical protein
MSLKQSALAATVALMSISNTASANTMVYGFGAKSCHEFIDARRNGNIDALGFDSWLSGYMTGLVQQFPAADPKIAASDKSGWPQWIENYCQKHPNDHFSDAASGLVQFLTAK